MKNSAVNPRTLRADAKAATRERVVRAASRAIRSRGLAGAGVASVMAEAGLTHGGFYAHFESKDELTAAAITASFADSRQRFDRQLADLPPKDALAGWIDYYVSPRHRDGPERGCALPALAAEVARGGDAARAALASGIATMLGHLSSWLTAANGDGRSGLLAAGLLAEAVGAVSLARALGAGEASDAILESTRTSLKRRAGVML